MSWLGVPLVLCLALLIFFVSVRWLRHRYPVDNNQLVDLVDALLPQTQCAQCGFAGCRPYAEALAANQAAHSYMRSWKTCYSRTNQHRHRITPQRWWP